MSLPRTPLVLAALALTACSGANGGAATVGDFGDWLEEHPFDGMRVVETSTAETLPYAGTADITVAVADADVASAADHVCDFEPRHANAVRLTVQASGIGVPVDCADPGTTAGTWGTLAALDGLQEVDIESHELHAVFEDDDDAVAAWGPLREIPVSRYELEVVGGWTLTDEPETTDAARDVVREALGSIYVVDRVTVTPDTPARPERVAIEVSSDSPLLRRQLLAGHPERRELVTVTESRRIPPQVSSSPTGPVTSR